MAKVVNISYTIEESGIKVDKMTFELLDGGDVQLRIGYKIYDTDGVDRGGGRLDHTLTSNQKSTLGNWRDGAISLIATKEGIS